MLECCQNVTRFYIFKDNSRTKNILTLESLHKNTKQKRTHRTDLDMYFYITTHVLPTILSEESLNNTIPV